VGPLFVVVDWSPRRDFPNLLEVLNQVMI